MKYQWLQGGILQSQTSDHTAAGYSWNIRSGNLAGSNPRAISRIKDEPSAEAAVTARQAFMSKFIFLLVMLILAAPVAAAEKLDVKVSGIKGELLKNVHALLEIRKRRKDDKLNPQWIERLHEQAPQQIAEALHPFGYYAVDVRASLEQIDDGWRATYQIDAGPRTTIRTLDIRYLGAGSAQAQLESAAAGFEMRVGDALDHRRYEAAKERLLEAAQDLGYVKAKPAVAKTLVDPLAHSADMTLHIETGPRYYFGEVRFDQDFLDQELVDQFVSIEPGQPFDHAQLLAFQQGLQGTDWASIVAVKPVFKDAQHHQVPIDVVLKPSKRHYFQFGLGYETDTGPRVSTRWLGRRLNTHGHHADVFLRIAPVNSSFRGTYFVPVVNPRTDRASFSGQYELEDTDDIDRSTLDLEAAFTRQTRDDTFFRKLSVAYTAERFRVGDDPWTQSRIFSLGAAARFTEIEDAFFTQDGIHGHADIRVGSSALLSDTSFVRLDLKGRYLFPIGEDGRFLARADVGLAWVEDFDPYPSSLRYFAGGGSSIRGYDYKSLGPTNDEGFVEGGKNLLMVSGEYDHRVAKQWSAALFVDAGNAFNNSLDEINVGAGAGARWLLGFGSLRVDVAWPVSDDDWELSDYTIHLGFGAAL